MLNKSVDPYMKIMNFLTLRLVALYRSAMDPAAASLLVPYDVNEKLTLLPFHTARSLISPLQKVETVILVILFGSSRKLPLLEHSIKDWIYWIGTCLIPIRRVNCMCGFFYPFYVLAWPRGEFPLPPHIPVS